MSTKLNILIFSIALVLVSCKKPEALGTPDSLDQQSHPSLILTKQGVNDIRANLGSIPIFDKTLAAAQKQIDTEIKNGFDVPVPKEVPIPSGNNVSLVPNPAQVDYGNKMPTSKVIVSAQLYVPNQ